jgi:hypothetical protein
MIDEFAIAGRDVQHAIGRFHETAEEVQAKDGPYAVFGRDLGRPETRLVQPCKALRVALGYPQRRLLGVVMARRIQGWDDTS